MMLGTYWRAGASWRINSTRGQEVKFSDRISLIYINPIEAFHVSV